MHKTCRLYAVGEDEDARWVAHAVRQSLHSTRRASAASLKLKFAATGKHAVHRQPWLQQQHGPETSVMLMMMMGTTLTGTIHAAFDMNAF